ncbi:MAG: hypothetical protein AMJ79_13615 [Phycisphaerae bacterium SM23_30]|nr:MAG: hypothetical protein AMJ79_13615 [Phycisphaerae bacterium SM23_30]
MIDAKRIGYLLGLALLMGLALVHLRTSHIQAVYEATCLREQQQQLRQDLWQQQALLSARMESPQRVKQRVAELGLPLAAPGEVKK